MPERSAKGLSRGRNPGTRDRYSGRGSWDVNQPAYHGKFRPEGRQAVPGHVPLRVVIGDDFRIVWKVADARDGSPAWPDPRSAVARAFPDEAVRRMIELLGELTERADQDLASDVVRYSAIHEIHYLKNAPINLDISIEINRRLIETLPNVRMGGPTANGSRPIRARTWSVAKLNYAISKNAEPSAWRYWCRSTRPSSNGNSHDFDRSKPRRPFMDIYEEATERLTLPEPR